MTNRLTCFDVTDYFLSLVNKESGATISNFKLQKLIYYAQGYHLALFDEPLFDERIEAQENGPAIAALLEKYLPYKSNPIDAPVNMDFSKYSENVKEMLGAIFREYGRFTPGQLRDMTHGELPWINGFNRADKTISNSDLKQYFKTQIVRNRINMKG
jgi:uncharacterized phage-associated protein